MTEQLSHVDYALRLFGYPCDRPDNLKTEHCPLLFNMFYWKQQYDFSTRDGAIKLLEKLSNDIDVQQLAMPLHLQYIESRVDGPDNDLIVFAGYGERVPKPKFLEEPPSVAPDLMEEVQQSIRESNALMDTMQTTLQKLSVTLAQITEASVAMDKRLQQLADIVENKQPPPLILEQK